MTSVLVADSKYQFVPPHEGELWPRLLARLTPHNLVERTIWSLWIGYILAYVTAVAIGRIDNQPEMTLYVTMSLVSSVILLVLGGLCGVAAT